MKTLKKIRILLPICLLFFTSLASCSDESNGVFPENGNGGEWDIPEDEIFDGGPGKDGIPSLEYPDFVPAGEADYLSDADLILGYKDGDDIRAYPHAILNWHEIVNDKINDFAMSVNYCPLTGTGIGWNRTIKGIETTFGVSGLLYNSNLILYDREKDSYWSQILLASVKGELRGTEAETFQLVETTWETWKNMYPQTKVLSTQTGYNRDYTHYPYGDYRTNHNNILFPYSPVDDRLQTKERVHGVIMNGEAKAYRLGSFAGQLTLIEDVFKGVPLLVVGNQAEDFIVSFVDPSEDNGTELHFEVISRDSPGSEILTDNEGNVWNVFGEAVSGPRTGERLEPTTSFMGFWFAWGAFYPGLQIY